MGIIGLLSCATPTHSAPSSSSIEQKCISVDSYHTYICTDNPEATRRAVDNGKSESDTNIITSAYEMDLGVEQRITGSENEQLRIRNVLRKMYNYFEEEVLSRSEYELVRGRCKNANELCAFWTSVNECETNRGFMLETCAAACRLCLLANTNMQV